MRMSSGLKSVACIMLFSLAACGQKSGGGVSYEKKSKSDIVQVCKSDMGMMFDIYRMRKKISDGQERKITNQCCKVVNKEAGKLSDIQRAWLWYRWEGNDDINKTPNQIEALKQVERSLRGDLNQAQYLQASNIKANASICAARAADSL
ncbi:MAG: hypothetical protein AAGC95_01835 [Pseudomonadota bacterium]